MQETDQGQHDLNALVQEQAKTIKGLESENEAIKAELCKKDNTYGFCGK